MKFKKGDIVIPITLSGNGNAQKHLSLNKQYTIKRIEAPHLYLEETNDRGWNIDRFKHVPTTFLDEDLFTI